MGAMDTLTIQIFVSGSTKVVDVLGTSGSFNLTFFSGKLVC